MVLGSRMRERRRERGLSQERLANQAGVTLSAIQRLEAGQVSDPHYSTLTGIAHALGTTVAELVGEKELVPLDEAPEETGPEERQRPSLDRVREVFTPLADGLNHYCARWEEKLPTLQGTSEEVADFFADLQDFRPIFLRVLQNEFYAIAEALDL